MTKAIEGVTCQVCRKQRAPGEIHPRDSRVLKGQTVLICTSCEASKFEPRSFIVIVARTRGAAAVADYIKQDRYVGKTIEAKEILK